MTPLAGGSLAVCFGLLSAATSYAYPTDAFERTGIRRLPWQQEVDAGKARGLKMPPGAQWPAEKIKLRLTTVGRDLDVTAETPKDPALQAGLEEILKRGGWRRYGVAVLDITDPAKPRYAGVHESEPQTPGSVAKVLVAAGLLNELRKRFPDDVTRREQLLKSTMVSADDWAVPNSHEVPVVTPEGTRIRRILAGDTFSLWEWMDHALSPSSNAAGTMLWREAILMRLLGEAYPPPAYSDELWQRWDKHSFSQAAFAVLDDPQRDASLNPEDFVLRMFFTERPGKYLESASSRVSPLALVRWLLRVEQGRMVDEFSSLELKRLLYLTRRRVRYAEAPELKDAAVFFKSGSLFHCKSEPGFTCVQYEGNVVNVLNALVEVETPDPEHPIVYLVAVMSNELKKNAAKDHGRLAGAIHKLVTRP